MVATQNTAIKDAYSRLQRVSEDDKKRAQAISREKALRDWNSSISASYDAGMAAGVAAGKADGMKEGRNQAINSMIRYHKSKNTSDSEIFNMLVVAFGLTRAEALEALQKTP